LPRQEGNLDPHGSRLRVQEGNLSDHFQVVGWLRVQEGNLFLTYFSFTFQVVFVKNPAALRLREG
jgi:hypothetical protein